MSGDFIYPGLNLQNDTYALSWLTDVSVTRLNFFEVRSSERCFLHDISTRQEVWSSARRTGGAKCKETAANCCKLLLMLQTAADCS